MPEPGYYPHSDLHLALELPVDPDTGWIRVGVAAEKIAGELGAECDGCWIKTRLHPMCG